MSQPAVTMQLRKLEKELGFSLTRPHGRGIELTESGRWLSEQAERFFKLEADIKDQCEAFKQGRRGRLKLAATYLPANFLLPGWIAAFRRSRPELSVSVSSGNASSALAKLLNFEAETAWIGGRTAFPSAVDAFRCYEDELWFVAAPRHRFAGRRCTLEELAEEPFILREPGSFTREALYSLYHAAGLTPPSPAVQFEGPQETIRAAVEGIGIAYATKLEVGAYIDSGVLAKIDTDVPPMTNPISCCTRAGDALSPAAEAFLAALPAGRRG